jgi:hypothetical protein
VHIHQPASKQYTNFLADPNLFGVPLVPQKAERIAKTGAKMSRKSSNVREKQAIKQDLQQ